MSALRPGEFARQALAAIEASEGRRKRRKRDTTPDRLGLDLKRDLLGALAADDPDVERIEAWLLERVLGSSTTGATRAMCGEILDEYRSAMLSPSFREWLASGAPSDDRDDASPQACDAAGACEHPDHRRMQAAMDEGGGYSGKSAEQSISPRR